MSTSFDDAKEPEKQGPTEKEGITDVYIGVFFDGTNNNMVQTARYKTNKVGGNAVAKFIQSGWQKIKKGFWYIADKTPLRDEKEVNVNLYDEYEKHGISGGYTAQEKHSWEKGSERGYSNIAVLHDNYKLNKSRSEGNSLFKHFYIEGSGATDTSHLFGGNPNGLGFGLGDTGVTALVSKAVKYVSLFIKSSNLDNNVKIHFFLFGFSRGATCARLFSHLITRPKGESIPRESEFSEFYAKSCFANGHLSFLEEYTNKAVEILGIYDTVASIGYLMQKDGEVHPLLRRMLHGLAGNYKNNWHYKNVYEYGLYLCPNKDKLKTVCHICAMDEFRENFALTDVGSTVPQNAIELMVPGCHSDVGGGYVDGEEEQEIILAKERSHNWDENSTKEQKEDNKKKHIQTKIYPGQPQQTPNSVKDWNLCLSNIEKLGWINNWEDKEHALVTTIRNKEKRYTLRAIEDEDYVKFKRNVRGVYSNITLKMMMIFANNEKENGIIEAPDTLFPAELPINFSVPKDLKDMEKGMVNVVNNAEKGQRQWIYPNGDYCCESYRKLRLKYLHFTSTSMLYHLNNPFNFKGVHTLEGTAGNLGNTPNFDLEGRLCRIVYHGDKKEETSAEQGLHYMYEYNGKNAERVQCYVEL